MKETDSNIIQIGTKTAEYLAFGDDFQLGNTLVYAFIIIKESDITTVENRINEVKKFYGISSDIPLHCRILFSGDARKKAGIDHLYREKIQSIIKRVVKIINQTPIFLRYAYCDLASQKKHFEALGAELELHDAGFNPKMKIPITPDPKGLLGLLAQMCLSGAPNDPSIPTVDKCQIIIAEDKSKVNFIGKNRRQAHYWSNGFSDIGTPPNKVFQLQPIIKKSNETPMLQIADIAAYICGQALNENARSVFFQEQLKKIKHWTNAKING